MQPLYKKYDKPAGVYSSGYLSYLFFEPKDGDKDVCDFIICREYPCSACDSGVMRADYRRHNIHYTDSYEYPRAYVWRDHARVYLSDVLATSC